MSSTTSPSLLRATTDLPWPPLDSQQLALQLTGKQHYRSFCLSLVSHCSRQPSPDVILVDLAAVPWRSHGRRFESILEMRRTSLRDVMDVGEVGIPIQTLWFYTLCSSTKSLQIPSPSLFKGEGKTHIPWIRLGYFPFIVFFVVDVCFCFCFFPSYDYVWPPEDTQPFFWTSIPEVYFNFSCQSFKHHPAFVRNQESNNYAVCQKGRCPCYLSPGKVCLDFSSLVFSL